jgi:Protein of unknown function (DUF3160)
MSRKLLTLLLLPIATMRLCADRPGEVRDNERLEALTLLLQQDEANREAAKSLAQSPGAKSPASGKYTWQAAAKMVGLCDADIERLGRQKILIRREQYRKGFEPYVHPATLTFISSDSLLDAFNALFQDSFRELEVRRAAQLRANLESALAGARRALDSQPGIRSELLPGWFQAQRSVGPAMVLLGSSLGLFDPSVRNDIELQLAKIRGASAIETPDRLAPSTATLLALDYRRLRPVGFYVGSRRMEDYFRAVRWLQMIPFRVERDQELTAIALLACGSRTASTEGSRFLAKYENFLGPADDWSLANADCWFGDTLTRRQSAPWKSTLTCIRKRLPAATSRPDDTLRLKDGQPTQFFRYLSAYRMPDAVLYQTLGDRGHPVCGLQMAALAGSSWAQARLPGGSGQAWAGALNAARTQLNVRSSVGERLPIYNEYLDVLGALFSTPDPLAPDFMRGDAWSAKSCLTALSAWAEMKHTFSLQEKVAAAAACGNSVPPGFIEPNLEFFRRLDRFLNHTQVELRGSGLFEPSVASALCLSEYADLVDSVRLEPMRLLAQCPYWESSNIGHLGREIQSGRMYARLPEDGVKAAINAWRAESLQEEAAALETLSRTLRRDAALIETGRLKPLSGESGFYSLAARWMTLNETTARLGSLVQKQLRGQNEDDDETEFMKQYGQSIAYVMGYFGTVYSPADDSPEWTEVLRDPGNNDSFAAAVGRPHMLLVLYPWHGTEYLTEGVAIPYYDDYSPTILTDDEWKRKLDQPNPPLVPSWENGILATGFSTQQPRQPGEN